MDAHTDIYSRRVAGTSLILSPALTATGWFILCPTIGRGPTRAWTLSHVLLASGWALYLPSAIGLARLQLGSPVLARYGTALVFVGVPLTLVQFVLDLLAARHAMTQADMDVFFGKLLATPSIAIPLYQFGPAAVTTGWLLHAIALLRAHTIPRWVGILISVAFCCILVGHARRHYRLVLAGHMVLGFGFVPLGWHVLRGKVSV